MLVYINLPSPYLSEIELSKFVNWPKLNVFHSFKTGNVDAITSFKLIQNY